MAPRTLRTRELEHQVLDLLERGPLPNAELARRLGISRRRLWDVLQHLQEAGRVRKRPDFRDLRRTLYQLAAE